VPNRLNRQYLIVLHQWWQRSKQESVATKPVWFPFRSQTADTVKTLSDVHSRNPVAMMRGQSKC
jgi:hypothetical protein